MKARRLNGCLRLKGDVSYRKEGGGGGGSEEEGEGVRRREGKREDREGRGEKFTKGDYSIILIIGNYCKTE